MEKILILAHHAVTNCPKINAAGPVTQLSPPRRRVIMMPASPLPSRPEEQAFMTTRITIRKPDDWHLHVRDGEMLKAVMPYTARHFGRAILMPNLIPPVTTTKDAIAYRERALAARPAGSTFQPLMTCYLTDDTDPDDVERGFRDGVFTGVKLYPANATTNSAGGVTDYRKIMRVLERMEKIDMPFLMHGEDVDPEVDIFDREAMFIERYLSKWVRQFPGLRFILEHLSSKDGVDFVQERSAPGRRHDHALPHGADPHRLAGLGAQALHVLHAGDQNRPGPRRAAQGRDLGRGLLSSSAPIRRRIRTPRKSP